MAKTKVTKKSKSSERLANDDQERLDEQQNRRRNAVEDALKKMNNAELLALVGELKSKEPGLILDILENGQAQSTSRAGSAPPWCTYDNCISMPTVLEEKCCGCSPNNCFAISQRGYL